MPALLVASFLLLNPAAQDATADAPFVPSIKADTTTWLQRGVRVGGAALALAAFVPVPLIFGAAALWTGRDTVLNGHAVSGQQTQVLGVVMAVGALATVAWGVLSWMLVFRPLDAAMDAWANSRAAAAALEATPPPDAPTEDGDDARLAVGVAVNNAWQKKAAWSVIPGVGPLITYALTQEEAASAASAVATGANMPMQVPAHAVEALRNYAVWRTAAGVLGAVAGVGAVMAGVLLASAGVLLVTGPNLDPSKLWNVTSYSPTALWGVGLLGTALVTLGGSFGIWVLGKFMEVKHPLAANVTDVVEVALQQGIAPVAAASAAPASAAAPAPVAR